MASLADYFEKNRPQPRYNHGDRVYGVWNGIPFAGTVGADIMINEEQGPLVTVFLELPIKYKDIAHLTFIKVKYRDIKSRLKSMDDEEPLKLPVAGSIPVRRTKQPKVA